MSLADLLERSGVTKLSTNVDVEGAQDMVQRYRPKVGADYNKNELIQDRQEPKDEAQQMIEMTLEQGDMASGLEKSKALGIRVPAARGLKPHQEAGQLNYKALSKGGLNFGKPVKVTRKDLYKLKGNAAKAVSLMRNAGFNGTIHGFGSRPNKSDHPSGRGVDFMTGNNRKMGNQIANYLVANRKQLGVKYVIYNQRIASANGGWKWRKMADRGSATANHKDHPHASFY